MTTGEMSGSDQEWVEALRQAAATGDLAPWYQPVVRVSDGEVLGFEALARWPGCPDGSTGPAEFVERAERLGVVHLVDLAVMSRAADALVEWREERPGLRMAVNCGAWVLDEPDGPDRVVSALSGAIDGASTVVVELTEKLRPRNPEGIAEAVIRLQRRGLEVWFDDFGTGWSELLHVLQVSIDGIKIDRYFTERIDGAGGVVVRALLDIARGLGLGTVIEGVSTQAHARRAQELGCEVGQGYWWSEPVPADRARELLTGPITPAS